MTATSGTEGEAPLYYVAGTSDKGAAVFKAAVYNATQPVPVSVRFEGIDRAAGPGSTATLTVLTGPENPYGFNDPFTRVNVVKETKKSLAAGEGGIFEFNLPPLSVALLEVAGRRR